MQSIHHLNRGTHSYCYGVNVKGDRAARFELTVRETGAAAADKALDALLKAQGIPFECATLRSSTDPDAAVNSRATDKS